MTGWIWIRLSRGSILCSLWEWMRAENWRMSTGFFSLIFLQERWMFCKFREIAICQRMRTPPPISSTASMEQGRMKRSHRFSVQWMLFRRISAWLLTVMSSWAVRILQTLWIPSVAFRLTCRKKSCMKQIKFWNPESRRWTDSRQNGLFDSVGNTMRATSDV